MSIVINNSLDISDVGVQAFTPSTVLIPKHFLKYYDYRVAFFGSRKLYFRHLITTYGRYLGQFGLQPKSNKWKKEYQKTGLGLQPRSFKPDPQYWEEFRHIAIAYGLGMCKLFVILLKLEHDRWKEAKYPENFFENLLHQPELDKQGMNSVLNWPKMNGFSLENLLKGNKGAMLIRSIDFLQMKLERTTLIRLE